MVDVKKKYYDLSMERRRKLEAASGLSENYLVNGLLPRNRTPKVSTLNALLAGFKAVRAGVTRDDLIKFFYG